MNRGRRLKYEFLLQSQEAHEYERNMKKSEKCETFFIALGANQNSRIGSPEITLRYAAIQLSRLFSTPPLCASEIYQTPCFPAGAGPDYLNAVVQIGAKVGALAVLEQLHQIEHDLGRVRKERWGARGIDLDLLAAGSQILPNITTWQGWAQLAPERQREEAPEQLIVPHPRLHERAFVLVPFAQIAPQWHHPALGRSIAQLCADLPESACREVVPVGPLL